jgi:hypothetical protein
MRLNALCLIGSSAALASSLPAGAVTAHSAEVISAQWGRQSAITAPRGNSATYVCPTGYYWYRPATPNMANLGWRIARAAGNEPDRLRAA